MTWSTRLRIKLAAALKITTHFIGTDEAALLIHELRAADGAKFPPGLAPFRTFLLGHGCFLLTVFG
jgi:hypothetical protein